MKDSNTKALANVTIDFDDESGIKLIEVDKKDETLNEVWDLVEDILMPFKGMDGLSITIKKDKSTK